MIDPQTETLINFSEAARRLPRNGSGKPVHAKTIARWALRGIRGLKLDTLCLGGRRVTSVEACTRFFRAIASQPTSTGNYPRLPRNEDVHRQLAERGYK